MTSNNKKKNYFGLRKESSNKDNTSLLFIIIFFIGVLTTGSMISDMKNEISILTEIVNPELKNQKTDTYASMKLRVDEVEQMYVNEIIKLENEIAKLEESNVKLYNQLAFLASNLNDLKILVVDNKKSTIPAKTKNKTNSKLSSSNNSDNNELIETLMKERGLQSNIDKNKTVQSKEEIIKNKLEDYAKFKNRENWNKLKKGMNQTQVIAILGQPSYADIDFITKWYYPNGRVVFDNDYKLSWWVN